MKKIYIILIIILVILLPIINSHIFNLIGIDFGFYVNGNYEFTKVIVFNILSGIITSLFLIHNFGKKIIIPKVIYLYSGILVLSILFSDFPITSIFGEAGKGHGNLMFFNLIGLFIVFINLKKKQLEYILKYIIFGSIVTIIFGIKEYYFPTFKYGNLSNRAIGTFGHPNYFALYLLVIIPLVISKITPPKFPHFKRREAAKFVVLILLIFLLFLTKSVWGIFIFLIYFIYILYTKNKYKINKNYLILLGLSLSFLLGFIIYKFGLFTKLNSFVSRFYIWQTTVNIIFSDIKNVFFGVGTDTLSYTFSNFKAPELYIFENFGYVADRPHNLVLNVFYHFGILGLILFIYSIYELVKNHVKKKNIFYFHGVVLFLIFTIFNFSSISTYLIIVLLLSIIYNKKTKKIKGMYLFPLIFIFIFSVYSSIIYYSEEVKNYGNKLYISENNYYNKLVLENPEKKIYRIFFTKEKICNELIKVSYSVESYFYCGDLFWNYDKNIAIVYYKLGLEKIPNMWEKNSIWYEHFLINKLYIPERFYSERYSNLGKILKKVGLK